MATNYMIATSEMNPAAGATTLQNGFHRMDESGLVAAAKRGHRAAFDELWQSHAKRLLRITYRITKNQEDAEDALQDSLLLAFVHVKNFDAKSSFATWLTRIAINSALMIVRKKPSNPELSLDDPRNHGRNPDVPAHAPDPEAHFAQCERAEILREAIRALRPTIRQAMELQKLKECTVSETAQELGLTLTAAKSRLFHGKTELRKTLTPETMGSVPSRGRFQNMPAA
jgi:RNA polymerase sigma factor (sigma-70 family)